MIAENNGGMQEKTLVAIKKVSLKSTNYLLKLSFLVIFVDFYPFLKAATVQCSHPEQSTGRNTAVSCN